MYNTWTNTGLIHTKRIVPDISTPKINYIGDAAVRKFKAGDKVRVVISDMDYGLYKGSVHTVDYIHPEGNIRLLTTGSILWANYRFELVQEDAVLTPEEVFKHLQEGTKLQRRQLNEQVWWDDNGNPPYKFIVGMQWRIKPEPEVIELNGKKYIEITE